MAIRALKPSQSTRRLVFGSAVALSSLLADVPTIKDPETNEERKEVPRVKWINVANEGEWRGHPDGEFKFTREVFDKFVTRARSHPKFKAAAEGDFVGYGMVPVVPFDYEHASELDPRVGSIAQHGAPAPAWALDFEVRDGEGGAELWALSQLGDEIRGYIANDGYRHVSIAFTLDATDRKTNDKIGPMITSIAFTNHPFLTETISIAARAHDAEVTASWYEAAGSVEQGLEYTRRVLGIGPTGGAVEIKAEISKLQALASDPDAAKISNPGVDVGEAFADLRKIWGLTVTKTVEEIIAEIDKGLASLTVQTAAQSAANAAVASAAAVTPPVSPIQPLSSSQEKPKMALSDGHKAVFKKLRLRKVKRAVLLFDEKSEEVTDAEVEAVVEDVAIDNSKFYAYLQALGVENAEEGLALIPKLKAALAQAEQHKKQLEEALAMNAEADTAAAEGDVQVAASTRGMPLDAAGPALKVYRNSLIESAIAALPEAERTPRKLFDARQAGRRKFLTEYGVPPEGQEKLLKNIAAAPGGQQLRVESPTTPVGNQPLLRGDGTGKKQIDLRGLDGRNTTERLCSWITKQDDGKNLSHNELHRKAALLKSDESVEIIDRVIAA